METCPHKIGSLTKVSDSLWNRISPFGPGRQAMTIYTTEVFMTHEKRKLFFTILVLAIVALALTDLAREKRIS